MFSRAARQLARNGRKFSGQARPRVNATGSAGPGAGRGLKVLGGIAALGGGAYLYTGGDFSKLFGNAAGPALMESKSKEGDYKSVRAAIASKLETDDYDDGSYGPLLVRLAWHLSGTYDKESKTGGSNGATMRFDPESGHTANRGLGVARNLLEPIKMQYPWITYADLYTLAGAVAIEEMGGPKIPWRPGREDKLNEPNPCAEDGRLPDASQGAEHLRNVFYRMGFDDRGLVALSGAHALGRCHMERLGYVNPWTPAPTQMSNMYFTELLDTKWTQKKWWGPKQFEDPSKELMMLPTDLALVQDKKLKQIVVEYAKDQDKFFSDFAEAFSKLLELGVPFKE
ncbi:hypothetical protein WJX74_004279 [Apatococcus lobatus]|uniref:Plant heme peroxidase family profile domain-containing protein n=2 Tax=Apatococcus TaxID=904362 RepID=A0AAW1TEJ1_9CHLO